jgi:hypothetical protein
LNAGAGWMRQSGHRQQRAYLAPGFRTRFFFAMLMYSGQSFAACH